MPQYFNSHKQFITCKMFNTMQTSAFYDIGIIEKQNCPIRKRVKKSYSIVSWLRMKRKLTWLYDN